MTVDRLGYSIVVYTRLVVMPDLWYLTDCGLPDCGMQPIDVYLRIDVIMRD